MRVFEIRRRQLNATKKAVCLVVALLFLLALILSQARRLRIASVAALQRLRGKRTVAERVEEYGTVVRRRLAPYFAQAGVSYPPADLVLVGLKHEQRVEVWASSGSGDFRLVRSYPILGASGKLGPKLRRGDRQVPEGLYRVESLNPNSLYHLALRLDYPNEFDRERAAEENRADLGGDIMIHGGTGSIGCLAMGDEAAEDLFVLAAETGSGNISVILSPVDFRVRELPGSMPALPAWTGDLYAQIRGELGHL